MRACHAAQLSVGVLCDDEQERTTTRLSSAKILLSVCAIFATTVSFARSRSVGISSQQFGIYCVFVAPSRLHYLAV